MAATEFNALQKQSLGKKDGGEKISPPSPLHFLDLEA
jgi:hypothetical protein